MDEGLPFVREIIERLPSLPSDEEIAWLGILLTHVRVRDEAWVRIDPDRIEEHIDLWREVLRRVEQPYVPAPAGLLAYAAFISGNGGLANVALDRALAADPGYSMAGLLRDVIQAGLPPSAARLRLSPEDLADAWNDLSDAWEDFTSWSHDGEPPDADPEDFDWEDLSDTATEDPPEEDFEEDPDDHDDWDIEANTPPT